MNLDMETAAPVPVPDPTTPNSASLSAHSRHSEPRRRNRPALSCIQCRTRKIRCDRNEPCASCQKSKIVNCTYEEARRPKPRLWPVPSPVPTTASTTTNTTTTTTGGSIAPLPPATEDPYPRFALEATYRDTHAAAPGPPGLQYANSAASIPSVRTSESASVKSPAARHSDSAPAGVSPPDTSALEKEIFQLRQQLADAQRQQAGPAPPSSQTPPSSQPPLSSGHALLSKPRYFGSGQCMDGAKFFPLIATLGERIESATHDQGHESRRYSEISYYLQQCKELGRSIKSSRVPTHLAPDVQKTGVTEDIAHRLVDAYFRTFESVYRILHIPTFWQEYRKYWDNSATSSLAYKIQFQLCMAIGTCFQNDSVALRNLATQWIYEAQVWLASPSEKSRMNLAGLQTLCLLHLARETCGVGGETSWISAGSLLRTAMHMGLHRDPENLHPMSVLQAELRRRLWATILEIVLQSSVDAVGPPMISQSDFDTRLPSNFDDDQLSEHSKFSPSPRPSNNFTQSTVQIAIHRSFAVRLDIVKYVNQLNSPTSYDQTLHWNNELTNACRALSAMLQPNYDPAGILPKRLSLFQLRMAEHMVHRFFLALNHPWMLPAQSNPAYYFARKMCVDTSLKLYRAFATGSPAGDSGTASQSDDFTRLSTCGHGAFRSVPTLAVLTICLELLWQAQEDRPFRQSMSMDHQLDRLGPAAEADMNTTGGIGSGVGARQDLLDAAKYSVEWAHRRLQAGETNVRGRVLYAALLTQVQALQRGAPDGDVERLVLDTISNEVQNCYQLLKGTAEYVGAGRNGYDSNGLGMGCEWDWEKSGTNPSCTSMFNLNDVDFFLGG